MQLNGVILRLALLLLPGLIGSKIYRKLRGPTEKQSWEDFAEVLVFSTVSYVIYFSVFTILHSVARKSPAAAVQLVVATQPTVPEHVSTPVDESHLKAFIDEKAPVDGWAIGGATLISIFVAFSASAISTHQIVNRVGFKVGATRRQGDAGVWTIFNRNYAPPTDFQWAFVRDHKANLVYFGVIRHFSDPGGIHELVLHNVSVFKNDSGEKLYDAAVLYIAREAGELSIEFPERSADNNRIETLGGNDVEAGTSANSSSETADTGPRKLESCEHSTQAEFDTGGAKST